MLEGLPQQIPGGIRSAMVCFPQVAHMPVDNREACHLRLGLLFSLTLPARIDIDTHERSGGGYALHAHPREYDYEARTDRSSFSAAWSTRSDVASKPLR